MTIDARHILDLLRARHHRDLVVAECPLNEGGGLRADLWVMKKSWATPLTTLYEIKVSRSDFLRDDKWPKYLPYCNLLVFAVAPGVCTPEELPEAVGLVGLTKNGGGLRTLRKAQWRASDAEGQSSVLKAVLMNRIMPQADPLTRDQRIALWKERAASAESVGRHMTGRMRQELADARAARDRADDDSRALETVREELRSVGIEPGSLYGMRRQLSQIQRDALGNSLRAARETISGALVELERTPVAQGADRG
jgi:hypothetical protein